jgi:hypothetical protein
VDKAAEAFTKMVFGRDLGLSPAQSMQLYVMEGKIEIPYPMWGHFIRRRPGYDYFTEWREEGSDEWIPVDSGDKEITGCRITFTVNKVVRAVSVWTLAHSAKAGLLQRTGRNGKYDTNHVLYPRNLFFARAMSNGVKMHVPEVTNGLPVYAQMELPRAPDASEGEGDGSEMGWKVSNEPGALSQPQVDAIEDIITRAQAVGHAAYSDRASIQVKLNGRQDLVEGWLRKATAVITQMEEDTSTTTAPTKEPEPEPEEQPDPDHQNVMHVVDIPALSARRYEHPLCGGKMVLPLEPDASPPIEGEALRCPKCGEADVPLATYSVDPTPAPDTNDEQEEADTERPEDEGPVIL